MIFFRWWNKDEIANDNLLEFDIWKHHRDRPYRAVTLNLTLKNIGQLDVTFVWEGIEIYKRSKREMW